MNKRRRHSSALHKNKIAMSGTSNKTNIKSRTDRRIVFVRVLRNTMLPRSVSRETRIPEERGISSRDKLRLLKFSIASIARSRVVR